MRLRTQTKPNHEEGVRDHVWGLDAIAPITGLFALGLTMIGMGISFANHMDDRMIEMQKDLSTSQAAGVATKDEMQRRVIEEDAIHKFLRDDYVRTDQYNHHNHGGRVPPEGSR